MVMKKSDITVISNSHLEQRDLLLNKLLKDNDMSQADLAKAVGKDATTINRWVKNSRAIAWENAMELAKVLKCHPVDIYQPRSEVILRWYVDWKYEVKMYPKENQIKIPIPFEYYHEKIRAVQVNIPGSHVDGEIYLFDIPQVKKFSSEAIGKYCYFTVSKVLRKKHKDAVDVMGILKANEDLTFSIMNPLTKKPVNSNCDSFPLEHLEIATPCKVKYNPNLLHKRINF